MNSAGQKSFTLTQWLIVIVAAMHDASTDKILNRDAIAAMRPTAYVVNIARGLLPINASEMGSPPSTP